jgi:hypothetical protein
MSIPLADFQRVNGGDDDLLPLYTLKNQPNIVGKRTIFLSLLGVLCFFITCIGISNFFKNTSLLNSQLGDDDYFVKKYNKYE